MQAGRELDLEVAKALGWKVSEDEGIFCDEDGHVVDEPKFSTTWEGMGVLVEEARNNGLNLDFHTLHDRFIGYADGLTYSAYAETAPHAVCLAFLMAKGIAI
ncbi:hypothetical protein [uncultured Brevibacillus sp.]|uniref:hypothetical protein n=1 Tax=uncultured Brevibacillus sp. TaxID=169970 RepID=UPI0025961273|nr:hypothetical protein [uncultured Brevibacillus sp.]